MSIEFGVFVPQGWRMDLAEIDDPVEQYEAMTTVARLADAGPWDSLWVYDHFHTVPEPTINTTFEAWTVSSTLARDTSRIKIGQMVGCNGYRHPSLFAKIASTVDVASHGRLLAGLGAGWYEHEWKAYGYEWTDVPERMRAFREAVEIVHRMWTEERPSFTGRHYRIDQPINEPKGAGRRKPDLWLGGGGEKVTLKLVAKYADGSNVGDGKPDVIRHKLDVLRRHCDEQGTDYDRIAKSTSLTVRTGDTVASIRERVEQVAEAGVNYVILYFERVAYDHEPLLAAAQEVVPRFA
ncbi:luciferase [Actinoplanes sp. SE50]|uniref:LLM class F420-dependent oxidoreductase n=1 Tax=unclassified Actinoplanes TaxID=2626549 RepID=UPI00023ED5AD|nr:MULTISPECIES: LLM class F420-dependent oxidoreductase [unclassified Actinoplanes]AEV83380.1 luciferase-like monooxygenase [Actinoplanes sp. SE50/110]ATO81773.1 luciferase [Actinoplanes sp. SE50]SLL99181.1 LLM class F420-dependent oxidoreductase [Actinoplanes sp. SE50/110]